MHGDHVDPIGSGTQPGHRLPHATLLFGGQLDARVGGDPRLHLDSNDGSADPDEQIDLAGARAQVGRQQPCPAAEEEAGGESLAEPA